MADRAAEDRLESLQAGLNLLSQLAARCNHDDPKLRAQLLQLSSAIVKLEQDVSLSASNHGDRESVKHFRPVAPTPKGKLLEIIESLKRASTCPLKRSTGHTEVGSTTEQHCDGMGTGQPTTLQESPDLHVEQVTDDPKALHAYDNEQTTHESLATVFQEHFHTGHDSLSQSPGLVTETKPVQQDDQSIDQSPRLCTTSGTEQTTSADTVPSQPHSQEPLGPLLDDPTHCQPLQHATTNSTQPEHSSQSTHPSPDTLSLTVPPPPPLPPQVPFPPPALSTLHVPTSTVTRYQPGVPLKPLFWKRVQFSSAQLRTNDSVWKHISEPAVADVERFVESFTKKGGNSLPVKSVIEKPRPSNVRPIRLLDSKRSQAVGILMRSVSCGACDLCDAVRCGDGTLVDREMLQAIHDMQASKEELTLIESHLNSEHPPPLDRPEMFLHTLSQVPQFSERLMCVLYSLSLPETSAAILDKLSMLSRVSHQLHNSTEIARILALILAMGNIMNSGNKVRGQADGFQLDILPKLKDVKTSDNSSNLLHYLVYCYMQGCEQTVLLSECPLPAAASLMTCAQLDFDTLRRDISDYKTRLSQFASSLNHVLSCSPANALEPFKSHMVDYQQTADSDAVQLDSLVDSCEDQFKTLVSYFCVSPPAGQRSVDPAYFFGLWSSFGTQFHDYWRQEKKSQAKERLRAEEVKRRNRALVKPTTTAGLKSRLRIKRSS